MNVKSDHVSQVFGIMYYINYLFSIHYAKKLLSKLLIMSLLFYAIPTQAIQALPKMPSESQLQAVFLLRFGLFVHWPDSAFDNTENSLNICIVGNNPFGDFFNSVIKDEKYNERKVNALYLSELESLPQCHILFVSESEIYRLEQIMEASANFPILTVSNIANFVNRGGMIEFYLRNNKVRFMIDPQTIRDVNLSVNANLLRVGDVVQ